MKCANPTLCYIDQDSNIRLFRSWDKANDAIKQNDHIPFNCGKCIACRKRQSLRASSRDCLLRQAIHFPQKTISGTRSKMRTPCFTLSTKLLSYTHLRERTRGRQQNYLLGYTAIVTGKQIGRAHV